GPDRVSAGRPACGCDALGAHPQRADALAAARAAHGSIAIREAVSARPQASGGDVAVRLRRSGDVRRAVQVGESARAAGDQTRMPGMRATSPPRGILAPYLLLTPACLGL